MLLSKLHSSISIYTVSLRYGRLHKKKMRIYNIAYIYGVHCPMAKGGAIINNLVGRNIIEVNINLGLKLKNI